MGPSRLAVDPAGAGYNWEHTASASLSLRKTFNSAERDNAPLRYTGKYVERPTITCVPLVREGAFGISWLPQSRNPCWR